MPTDKMHKDRLCLEMPENITAEKVRTPIIGTTHVIKEGRELRFERL